MPLAIATCTVGAMYVGGDVVDGGTTPTGTITSAWGWHVSSLPPAQNVFPFGAASQTIAGTVPPNDGAWGVTDSFPTRLWFRDDAQHVWRSGTITMVGAGISLGTGTSALYFAPNSRMDATATFANAAIPTPGFGNSRRFTYHNTEPFTDYLTHQQGFAIKSTATGSPSATDVTCVTSFLVA